MSTEIYYNDAMGISDYRVQMMLNYIANDALVKLCCLVRKLRGRDTNFAHVMHYDAYDTAFGAMLPAFVSEVSLSVVPDNRVFDIHMLMMVVIECAKSDPSHPLLNYFVAHASAIPQVMPSLWFTKQAPAAL